MFRAFPETAFSGMYITVILMQKRGRPENPSLVVSGVNSASCTARVAPTTSVELSLVPARSSGAGSILFVWASAALCHNHPRVNIPRFRMKSVFLRPD
jgi:hypothetical protein